MPAYKRLPVSFNRGEGVHLWDSDGNQYLDALGGIAVTFLGHSHPQLSEAISLQANQLLHTSNLFHIEEQTRLGQRFCKLAGMDNVFFTNSGTEANEAAIKIARLQGRKRGIKSPIIICMNDSFHGRTLGSLSATGNPSIQKDFEPLLPGFIHVDFNQLQQVEAHINNPDVVAVMVEPIQGESGVRVPDPGYLTGLRELCSRQQWLLMLDEIQTGMGRTGAWFACQHEAVTPDVLTSAKALGNGIPIGACAARGEAAKLISPGAHGSTFGGNPFACRVALTVIDIMEQDNLPARAAEIGTFLKKQLQQKLGTLRKVTDIRGMGLMLAVELDQEYAGLAERFLQRGLLINVTCNGKVLRILPAVLLSEGQARQIAQTIHDVVTEL